METSSTNGTFRRVAARLAAVLAIAIAVVALVMVVGGSLSDDGGGGGDRAERRAQQREKEAQNAQTEKVYVVQPNDTLEGIAEKTGVSVEQLQDLNPDIDPQALPSGAQLQLR